MKTIIAIDPGASGGIVWRDEDGIHVEKMPDTPSEIYHLLLDASFYSPKECVCYIEKVGAYMTGNSATAAVTFARHCGHLDMALLVIGISHHFVTPAVWMRAVMGAPAKKKKIPKGTGKKEKARILGKEKTKRKNAIKAKMQQIFPTVDRVTLWNADALGILQYGIEKEK